MPVAVMVAQTLELGAEVVPLHRPTMQTLDLAVVLDQQELVVLEQAGKDTTVVLAQALPTNGLTVEAVVVLQALVQTAHITQPQTAEMEFHLA